MAINTAIILCFGVCGLGAEADVYPALANPPAPLVATVPLEPAAAADQGTLPVSEPPAVESTPLGRAPVNEAVAGTDDEPSASAGGVLQHPAVRTGGALTLVLSLIFGLRSLVHSVTRRAGGLSTAIGPGGRAPSGVLSVLGRYPVGKGQTLVLLQLDRRVLLLSQTSSGFSTLCELADPADVASVVRKTADDEGASLSKRFSSMLRRFESDPSIAGDGGASPVSPRRAMALRDYEASLASDGHAIAATPGAGDSFTSLQGRLQRLRGGAS